MSAARDDDNGNESGSVYLFDACTGEELAKLKPKDGSFGDFFGSSVALSGPYAVIAAQADDTGQTTNSGSAYLFDVATRQELFKFEADDAAFNDIFGNSIGISGNHVVVGAWQEDGNGSDSGSAYQYKIDDPENIFFEIKLPDSISIQVEAEVVELEWSPFGDGNYRIQTSTLLSGDWADHPVVVPQGQTTADVPQPASPTKQFYRVRSGK